MRRFEYKYIAPIDIIEQVRNYILGFADADAHMRGLSEYTVRSIYFDTPDFEFYNDKVDGLDIRKKVRIRGYNQPRGENEIVFLEIKRKKGASIRKNRAPVQFKDLKNLISSGDIAHYVIDGLKGFENSISDAKKFFYNFYRKNLSPKILVVYEREAYHDKNSGEVRITFDKNLRSWVYPDIDDLFVERNIVYLYVNNFIIEIKLFYDNLPFWFKFVIDKFSLKRVSFSKYVICADTHGLAK